MSYSNRYSNNDVELEANTSQVVLFDQPSEVSVDEYNNLVQQIIDEYTIEDCSIDILECCRYDDIDVVRAILKIYPTLLFYQDPNTGNTPLHMAAANGHLNIVCLLLAVERLLVSSTSSTPIVTNVNDIDETTDNADVVTSTQTTSNNVSSSSSISLCSIVNKNGNTPLHWAVSNNQIHVVRVLLQQKDVDVLQQNNFGRSILTEGFAVSSAPAPAAPSSSNGTTDSTSNNDDEMIDTTTVVSKQQEHEQHDDNDNDNKNDNKKDTTDLLELLLQHDSASEDKLVATKIPNKSISQQQHQQKLDSNSNSKPNPTSEGVTIATGQQSDFQLSNDATSSLKQQQQQAVEADTNSSTSTSEPSSITHSFTFGSHHHHHQNSSTGSTIDTTASTASTTNTIINNMGLTNAVTIQVRELAIATSDNDTILGQSDPNHDTTGYGIWSSSLICSQWMVDLILSNNNNSTSTSTANTIFHKDSIVLELGSGCGVPGLSVAATGIPSTVYLTDFNIQTVLNLQYNVNMLHSSNQRQQVAEAESNSSTTATTTNTKEETTSKTHIIATTMNWSDQSTWPTIVNSRPNTVLNSNDDDDDDDDDDNNNDIGLQHTQNQVDVVIGSDLIYQIDMVPLLVQTISALLKCGGHFFYVAPATTSLSSSSNSTSTSTGSGLSGQRQGHDEFIATLLGEEGRGGVIQGDKDAATTTTNFTLQSVQLAPKEYYTNPLTNGDDELAFIHFSELYTTEYNLYHFQKK